LPPLKAAGLRPDRAAKQIGTHENKFAEVDCIISERGDSRLIGRAFRVPQQIPRFGGDYIIFIDRFFAVANIYAASRWSCPKAKGTTSRLSWLVSSAGTNNK